MANSALNPEFASQPDLAIRQPINIGLPLSSGFLAEIGSLAQAEYGKHRRVDIRHRNDTAELNCSMNSTADIA